ncbi:MAG: 3D domain-containing protein [Kovacikia sp.]
MPRSSFPLSQLALSCLIAIGFSPEMLPQSWARADMRRSQSWLQIETPKSVQARPLSLWATYYYVHRAQAIPNGQPLLDRAGDRLGPTLSTKDWCYAALQGTVLVEDGRHRPVTYNFSGRGASPQVDCSPFFSSLSGETLDKVNRVRFSRARAAYGYGTGGFKLVPYRTIAVDRSQIPIGSVLYVPAARGRQITLPSGEQVIHDGYFFAADVGSAIHGNHIDVFVGTAERNPFSFIASRSSGTFKAFLVQAPEITQVLWALHAAPLDRDSQPQ